MHLRPPILALTAGLALLGAASFAVAQIERLDLSKMVERADHAVFGTIVDHQVIVIDHEIDGPELYYTHLTLEGFDLATNEERTVVVSYAGGFIDAQNGVYNSEAPPADAVRLGSRAVVFYAYTENMGGDLAANAIYASHGGLYQTVTGRGGDVVVLGQGDGYAISQNIALHELQERVAVLTEATDKLHGK
ncbi:MAG: hypothetical protein H0V12_03925 [Chloroflexi bacterium]|nr:hypothetical protein [Chloroflexota bacterium]